MRTYKAQALGTVPAFVDNYELYSVVCSKDVTWKMQEAGKERSVFREYFSLNCNGKSVDRMIVL
jgi:hypothetical protein